MDYRVLPTARAMEAFALDAARAGALVLTPTSRLAKRYRHAHRVVARGAGEGGAWDPPEIMSLRRWVKQAYDGLWEPRALPDKAASLALWAEAVEGARKSGHAPPAGLQPSPSLCAGLQAAYDSLHRCGVREEERDSSDVSMWRAAVTSHFERLCRERGVASWNEVLEAVRRALLDGRATPPEKAVAVLGPMPPDPPLEGFLASLSDRTPLEVIGLPGVPPPSPQKAPCAVCATPEQECRAACSRALGEWNRSGGRASLAIIPLDESLFPLLHRCMDELSGRRPPHEAGQTRYNLAWGPPLTGDPLFVAGTLPLVLGEQADPVGALAALLRSPFSDPGRFDGFEETLSRLWARGERVPAARAVREVARRFPSLAALGDFLPGKSAPLSLWVQRLRGLWGALGFPWRGGSPVVRDRNAAAFAQLDEALRSLELRCGQARTDAAGALAWLTALCEGQSVAEPGAETAGIQLLTAADACGHAFDAVWCVGAHGDALPRARGAEPLLSPAESLALSGGDHQKRAWEEGAALLGALLASCGDPSRVTFSRAKSETDGQRPYTPSPLLEDRFGEGTEDGAEIFDVWGAERPLWLAAPWLDGAYRGLAEPSPAPAEEPSLPPLRSPLSVTALNSLLKCPFRYFGAWELGLEPPPEAAQGVSPLARGTVVHEILAAFTAALGGSVPEWPERMEEAWGLLRATALERLSRESGPYWSAEAVRLLGEDEAGSKGVLRAWLEAEREWASDGWRTEPPAERGERPFRGLELGAAGVVLEGRVDRVDRNETRGARAVWDYKSGSPPAPAQVLRDMTEGQIPAYLLALRGGRLDPEVDGRPVPWTGGLEAGYIPLKKASEVSLKPLAISKYHASVEAFLRAWVGHAQERLSGPLQGRFPPDPDPPAALPGQAGTACEHCPFSSLCGYFDAARASRTGTEEDSE